MRPGRPFLVALGLFAAALALRLYRIGSPGYSSYLIDFMPFVVLEGTWALVAAVVLVRTMLGYPGAPPSHVS